MPVTREPVLLKPRIEEFLTYCEARNLSRNTVRAYRSDLISFVELCGGAEIIADEINRKLIRNFMAHLHERGISRKSVTRKVASVKSFTRWLEGEDLLDAGLNRFDLTASPS